MVEGAPERPTWTFLTNHAHVLLAIAQNPDVRLRELADLVGVTERAAHRIVTDLVEAGYVRRARVGRRNHYEVDGSRSFRHPMERSHQIGLLLRALDTGGATWAS